MYMINKAVVAGTNISLINIIYSLIFFFPSKQQDREDDYES